MASLFSDERRLPTVRLRSGSNYVWMSCDWLTVKNNDNSVLVREGYDGDSLLIVVLKKFK